MVAFFFQNTFQLNRTPYPPASYQKSQAFNRIIITPKLQAMKIVFPNKQPDTTLTDHQWISKVREIILAHLQDKDFTVAQIAKEALVSERQLYRKVKKLTGKTPNRYLHELRLHKAKEHLESGRFNTIKAVALSVGFTRTDYFSKVYEAQFGVRPIDYFVKE